MLQILIAHSDEEENITHRFEAQEEEKELKDSQLDLSLRSIVGITTPKTMKLKGTLGGRDVIVLIDSGANHNFLSITIVEQLCL